MDINICTLYTQDGETPLHKAAKLGRIEAVKFLVLNGADVNPKLYEVWIYVCLHFECTYLCIFIYVYYVSCIHICIRYHVCIIGFLIYNQSTLYIYICVSCIRICIMYTQHKNETPLQLAANRKRDDVVVYLVLNGAFINFENVCQSCIVCVWYRVWCVYDSSCVHIS